MFQTKSFNRRMLQEIIRNHPIVVEHVKFSFTLLKQVKIMCQKDISWGSGVSDEPSSKTMSDYNKS